MSEAAVSRLSIFAWRMLAIIASLAPGEMAVATSGDYEQFFEQDGERYCHLLDPRTGDVLAMGSAPTLDPEDSSTWVGDAPRVGAALRRGVRVPRLAWPCPSPPASRGVRARVPRR